MKYSKKETIIILIPVFLIFILAMIRPLFGVEGPLPWIKWVLAILLIIPVIISFIAKIWPRINKNVFISSVSNSISFYLSFFIILIAVNGDIFPEIPSRYDMSMIGVGLAVFVLAITEYERRNPEESIKKFALTNRLNAKYEKLANEVDRIEKIVKDCKNLVEEIQELQEEEDKKPDDT